MSTITPEPLVVEDVRGLTPEWVTNALQAGGRDVTVAGLRSEQVGTGQMAACYRLHLDATAGPGAEPLPATIVAKVPPEGLGLTPTSAGAFRNEVAFYTELAGTVAIRVPACHHAAFDEASSAFTLLLEDMAPARQGDQVDGCDPTDARVAVVNLAGLHAPRWCDPTLVGTAGLTVVTDDDAEMLAQVMGPTTEAYCERYRGRIAPEDEAVLRAVPAVLAAWSLGRSERFAPVHGDYRLDNLLFATDGSGDVAAVDWQTLSLGLPARDLAYFLGTGLTVEDRQATEHDLIAAYHAELVAQGVEDYPLDLCVDDYRFGLLQGPLISVAGSMFSNRTDRGDDMFMAMTSRTCTAIRDHGTLDMF